MTKANPLGRLAVGCFRGVMVWAIIGWEWLELDFWVSRDFSALRQRHREPSSNKGDKTGSGWALLGKTRSDKEDGGKIRMVGILSIHKKMV